MIELNLRTIKHIKTWDTTIKGLIKKLLAINKYIRNVLINLD